jgi:tetratricopeptide (TPR) repeat protein
MRFVVAAAVIAVVSWAAPARAQDDVESRARAHFEIGQGLDRLGDYRGAIKEFAAGYALVKKPAFLLNIGTMYKKLGERRHARDMYRQFLETAPPDDAKRTQAEEMVRELEDQLRANPEPPDEPAPAPPTTPAVAPQPEATPAIVATPPKKNRRALVGAGIAVGIVGVLALGGGIGSGVAASNTADDLNAIDKSHGVFDPAKDSLYGTERTVEGVLLGVGAAATVTGIVLIIVGRR